MYHFYHGSFIDGMPQSKTMIYDIWVRGIWRDYVYAYNGDYHKQEDIIRNDEAFLEMQWNHTHATELSN